MTKVIISPGKYIQGNGELSRLKEHSGRFGDSFFFLTSKRSLPTMKETLTDSFQDSRVKLVFEPFNGECSKSEIERLRRLIRQESSQVIVGVGGGKILDTAKAVAHFEGLPVIIIPTAASSDAPCSALSVLYTDAGVFSEYLFLPHNPEIVLVDTEIIAKAPVRLLVSGMGDALATYFEARACRWSNAATTSGAHTTKAAQALAELCYQTLLEDGYKAMLAVEQGVVTPSLENVVEANTYLSGIGFESGGLAAAHSIHNGFTAIEACRRLYHGEKVAFGTIAQLMLENSPTEELEEAVSFCCSVGLPITLADLGIEAVDPAALQEVAKLACAPGETIHNMPFTVTPEMVYAAILAADAYGKKRS